MVTIPNIVFRPHTIFGGFNDMTSSKIPLNSLLFFALTAISRVCMGDDAEVLKLAQLTPSTLQVHVSNILDVDLPGKVVLHSLQRESHREVALPSGRITFEHAPGAYDAYTYIYEDDVPFLVDVQTLELRSEQTTALRVEVLEGSSGNRPIAAFDQDFDQALDRVELQVGTAHDDARSIPGVPAYDWPTPILNSDGAWYKGELHAHSAHGRGTESVAELIRRAEKLGLDFLAITDRNTLASTSDPAYKSNSLVLVPGMEWGNDNRGVALIYAPGSFPEQTDSIAQAQAMAIRVQAQGGIFAIAHPVYPGAAWQWGINYANAVETWCRPWRSIRPISLDQLDQRWRERRDGKLVHSLAVAAATQGFSANAQSTLYWDLELVRGAKAGVIAGSNSDDPKVPLGAPVTYVYGREKSLLGILEGLRMGRTFVSRDLDGPTIEFQADVLADGSVEVGMGGIIPINRSSRLIIGIEGAKGARMDILLNGYPIRSRPIDTDKLFYSTTQQPDAFAVYRVRIVRAAQEPGYGPTELLAMSSPIYAQSYVVEEGQDAAQGWVQIDNEWEDPRSWEGFLPPDARPYETPPPPPLQP